MSDTSKSFQPTRRGFMAGAAAAFGFAGSAQKILASIAPTQAEVTTAYGWLADHMMEGVWDCKGYMPSHILKTMQTISHHLNASGLPNPVEGKLAAVRQLSELDPDRWTAGMPLRPSYEAGSPERILMQEVADMLDPVSALLKQPTPMEKILLDKQAAFVRSRTAMQALRPSPAAATEDVAIEEECAGRTLVTTATRRSALQSTFGNFVKAAPDDASETPAALPAPSVHSMEALPVETLEKDYQPAFFKPGAPAP